MKLCVPLLHYPFNDLFEWFQNFGVPTWTVFYVLWFFILESFQRRLELYIL